MTDTGVRLSLRYDLRARFCLRLCLRFGSGLRRDLTSPSGLQIDEGLDLIKRHTPVNGAN
jgi:hypothetical protein